MHYRTMIALSAFAAGALAATAGHAASFDCANAATPTEHAICDNPQLSQLDDQMAGLYYSLISGEVAGAQATPAEVKAHQEQFISQRNSCGANYNCLIDAYTSEIMYLNASSGKGM